MVPLLKRIHTLISSTSLLCEYDALIIGVSGGSDSIALLHILSKLFPASKRIAVYVDHGLRPAETDSEKELVQRQAEICSAHFETLAVDVQGFQKENNCSLEEAARILRYKAFEKFRRQYQAAAIAVGHTANDQAEEVLLRLIRGSGSTGLSGMNLQRGKIIRPLLHETKETLLSYLQEQHIPFCQDSSNLDTRFLRNKIRLKLLPLLQEEYNVSMQQTLLQTAAILKDEDQLLADLTQEILPEFLQVKTNKTILAPLSEFIRQPVAIQRRVLETICWTLQSKPSFKKIKSLLKLAATSGQKEIHLSAGLRGVRNRDSIIFYRPSPNKSYRGSGIIHKTFSPLTLATPGRYPVPELGYTLTITKHDFSPDLLTTPDTQLVDAKKCVFPLILRPLKPGDCFHPLGAPGHKKVSRFLSDQKIPPLKRDHYPMLVTGKKILSVAGLRIDHTFRVTDTTTQVLLLQWRKKKS